MRPPRLVAAATATLVFLSTGCEEGVLGPEDIPEDLLVTWFATSLLVDGRELLDDGMRLKATFGADGTYEMVATRDLTQFICDGGIFDCTAYGTFTATASEVVFDPDDEGGTTLSASINEGTLRLQGEVDELLTIDLSFVTAPIPDLIGTWTATYLMGGGVTMTSDDGEVETTLAVTFEADGSFTYAATASGIGEFCDYKVSCVGSGVYVADAESGQVTFDPADPDPEVFSVDAGLGNLSLVNGDADWGFTRLEVLTPGEQGLWYAISMVKNGAEIADPDGWNSTILYLTGAPQGMYSFQTYHADPEDRFLCGGEPGICELHGEYRAEVGTLELIAGDGEGTSLSMDVTPTTLRLLGTFDGASVDFLYVRVPCGVWAPCF